MNVSRLCELVESSKLSKMEIAKRCNISRTTLDNVLAGADAKISTIEALSITLNTPISYLFGEDVQLCDKSEIMREKIEGYEKEIERLQTLVNAKKSPTKIIVELEVDDDEFIKMGLKDKVIQILNK